MIKESKTDTILKYIMYGFIGLVVVFIILAATGGIKII